MLTVHLIFHFVQYYHKTGTDKGKELSGPVERMQRVEKQECTIFIGLALHIGLYIYIYFVPLIFWKGEFGDIITSGLV